MKTGHPAQALTLHGRGRIPAAPNASPALTIPNATPPFIVLDACVLMSGILRRLLLRLAEAGVFQPVWTERIGEE